MKISSTACLLLLLTLAADARTYLDCGKEYGTKPSDQYKNNVRIVIQRMGKFTVNTPDLAYRTYEASPDVFAMAFCSVENRSRCGACVKAALRDIRKCGNVFGAVGTRNGCKMDRALRMKSPKNKYVHQTPTKTNSSKFSLIAMANPADKAMLMQYASAVLVIIAIMAAVALIYHLFFNRKSAKPFALSPQQLQQIPIFLHSGRAPGELRRRRGGVASAVRDLPRGVRGGEECRRMRAVWALVSCGVRGAVGCWRYRYICLRAGFLLPFDAVTDAT
ncbi:uncharacterized protein A4U43_C07F3940 [Asparagus officinalis]|uniref:Gnk2-homologous domain-containing protein n=1 Tax=Asparagus officinalis TaxID=4686 RepID=A0A5P1E968_ASPOF|nr:uncharacterized protein A4U43_C07F3940 [Asparagus officinalis]